MLPGDPPIIRHSTAQLGDPDDGGQVTRATAQFGDPDDGANEIDPREPRSRHRERGLATPAGLPSSPSIDDAWAQSHHD